MEKMKRSWKLQEFVAHKATVNCLAMGHKSNQVLATGGDDKKVNLWAIGRQSCLMSLSGHTTPVECVSFSHSEDLVCAGSQLGNLKIWDLEAAKLLRTFTGHKGAIKCMDFHPYGDYLTTGSCDSFIKLWDTRKKNCIVTYSSHRLAVNSVQFSPDGQWIASACDDGLVKVWDVRMGKVLQEFAQHSAGVTCVQFHPHEFLLASCSVDRTVNFWDMEKFQLVSSIADDVPIRHMSFSEDGVTLLGAAADGLRVVGWEPARVLDAVPSHWGHIHDITVAHNQLIAGSFHSTYVSLWVVELNKVHPFGGPPPPQASSHMDTSPFQKGQSVRKSFSKERPAKEVLHTSTTLDDKTVEESTSGTEADEDAGAVIGNISDYREIFRPSRALNRTPPPSTSISSNLYTDDSPERVNADVERKPSPVGRAATSLRDLNLVGSRPSSPPTPHHSPPQRHKSDFYSRIPTSTIERRPASPNEKVKSDVYIRSTNNGSDVLSPSTIRAMRDLNSGIHSPPVLNRHNSYKEKRNTDNYLGGPLRQSNSDASLSVPSLGPRSLSFSRSASDKTRNKSSLTQRVSHTSEREPEPEFVPTAIDRPVGLDLDEFLPRSSEHSSVGRGVSGEPSEQEVLGVMMRGHDPMMAVLTGRQRSLQIFHSVRTNRNLKCALDSTIALDDLGVLVDILNVMAHKPSLWNLDICLILLPKIYELLQSKYESYMQCGCSALRLIVRNFSSVVKGNIEAPVRTLGVDIPREERYAKCVQIHRLMVDIRAFLLKRQTLQGRLGAAFRDLHTLMQQGF